ncbi:MAG: YqgE/AlgH family protein [Hyphomicrobiales bacterium]
MGTSFTGKLLVATPKLEDPNFHRTVVFVLMHDENGAFGLVVNRALELPVEAVLPAWSPVAVRPGVIFSGGPVEPTAAIGVGWSLSQRETPGFTHMTDGIGLVDLRLSPGELPIDDFQSLRVFSGYAGWGAGQLEAEVEQEAWFVVDSSPADAFPEHPESLWRDVLLRQRGKLAMFAFTPVDPRVN